MGKSEEWKMQVWIEGFRAAREKAAEIASEYITEEYRQYEWVKDIVEDIRQMEPGK